MPPNLIEHNIRPRGLKHSFKLPKLGPYFFILAISLFISAYWYPQDIFVQSGLGFLCLILALYLRLEGKIEKLDIKQKSRERRPHRIILIRHGESEGNIDPALYGSIPDNLIRLSEAGIQQAKQAGIKLKEIVGNESMRFFYSPYKRSEEVIRIVMADLE